MVVSFDTRRKASSGNFYKISIYREINHRLYTLVTYYPAQFARNESKVRSDKESCVGVFVYSGICEMTSKEKVNRILLYYTLKFAS